MIRRLMRFADRHVDAVAAGRRPQAVSRTIRRPAHPIKLPDGRCWPTETSDNKLGHPDRHVAVCTLSMSGLIDVLSDTPGRHHRPALHGLPRHKKTGPQRGLQPSYPSPGPLGDDSSLFGPGQTLRALVTDDVDKDGDRCRRRGLSPRTVGTAQPGRRPVPEPS
jgi:hypothetical protein